MCAFEGPEPSRPAPDLLAGNSARLNDGVDYVDDAVGLKDVDLGELRHASLLVSHEDVTALHGGPEHAAADGLQHRSTVRHLYLLSKVGAREPPRHDVIRQHLGEQRLVLWLEQRL